MTSDKGEDPGKGSGPKKTSAARRPAPTIELKATEVVRDAMADKPAAVPPAAPDPVATADTAPPQDSAASRDDAPPKHDIGGDVPPRGPDQPERPAEPDRPAGRSWTGIGAGVAAGLVCFLLGIAAAHLFLTRDVAMDAPLDRAQSSDRLAERLAKLETALSAPRTPDAALIGRIASAESAARLAAGTAAAQQRRADELAALVRETRSRADAAAVSADAAQKGASAAASDGVRVDMDALNLRIANLEQALKANEAELARRAASAADDRKNRTALVASVLLGTVERGAPFVTELAATKALAPDNATLAPLEPFAAQGVPAAAALSRELSALMPVMLKTLDNETRGDGGFLDRLQANAERLVRVRPVGEVSGDRPVDVLARLEAKAATADIAGALSDLATLPPQVRAPAEGWIAKAAARNSALAAARQFSLGALAALGKPNT
jgi:hypothetical protein